MTAVFAVYVGGQNITATLNPILNRLSVSDRAAQSSDSATLEIDDTDGQVLMPSKGAPVTILLGWEDSGVGVVFEGTVDDIRAQGGRSGRTLSISAKGMDTRGKAKEPQRRHFDDTTIGDALTKAGEHAGISVSADAELAKIVRPYLALDDESFVAFGERIAREVGGTFKIVGTRAILAKRNGGTSAGGAALSSVSAVWGQNLHDYDIAPILGRPVEKEARARWYDPKQAQWMNEVAPTGTEDGETIKTSLFSEADQGRAKEQSGSDATESDRKSGEGSVTIEGNISAQPEGTCLVSGCRPGIDGSYRIEGVNHEYSRSGFVTRLELGQPKGEAGKDSRGKKKKSRSTSGSDAEDDDDFSLPTDPELG
jgi:phage protein D